ncbi:MAG TPA: hypothetical protein VFT74_19995, partial [Isosphaeraceae bacterium]|nr:hypothetical protein [Isosphaeraceae bacterium]
MRKASCRTESRFLVIPLFLMALSGWMPAVAQDARPAPSASATQLPMSEPAFQGKIGLTYKDSQPVKPELKIPATFGLKNPPNILIVLIDDAGYGQFGTFGGAIPTPTMD